VAIGILLALLLCALLLHETHDYFGVLAWRNTPEFESYYRYLVFFWLISAVGYVLTREVKYLFALASATLLGPAYFWLMLSLFFWTGSAADFLFYAVPIIIIGALYYIRDKDWRSALLINLVSAGACVPLVYQQTIVAVR